MPKIEIRHDCKECWNTITHNRYRTFCSEKCRVKNNNEARRQYGIEWQKENRRIKYLCKYYIKKHNALQPQEEKL